MNGRKLSSTATSLLKRGGRKRVFDAEETTTKRTKATMNVGSNEDEGGRGVEQQDVKVKLTEGKDTGKAKKGEKTRMAEAKGNVENEKGVSAHLTPVEQVFNLAGTSVAPPSCSSKSEEGSDEDEAEEKEKESKKDEYEGKGPEKGKDQGKDLEKNENEKSDNEKKNAMPPRHFGQCIVL